ncbi:Thioredoxin-like fold domain-containing protein MRL7L, chloroplastic [Sesamum alatum]|uniref:Thioredoxin-like fold domain-containing protein MRL7L, chloroplastic n=1 Tax=Sesamum alatum TaxID=300844 RepID=A0AAE1YTU3_9LAMI|nr:Thioredoxin-like fold domain-containing protein MRL7L, chloroplastic [Sesamum alatum]
MQGMELLQHTVRLQFMFSPLNKKCPINFLSLDSLMFRKTSSSFIVSSYCKGRPLCLSQQNPIRTPPRGAGSRRGRINVSKIEELLKLGEENEDDEDESSGSEVKGGDEDSFVMDAEERKEWRRKIREVMGRIPDVEEETDLVEKRKKMQKLLAEYPLVVEEEDPDWPEDADGWGFNLGQFFNKISIKNVKKDDDENYDSENEIVWQDDDYIRPIKDITTAEWEEAIFKDISPLVVLVHNRYRRPKENEKIRDELEKAVNIIWNCRLPSPRCVAIDAVVEPDLVSALKVSVFPELIFTRAGKILYREKALRTADELSKIMAFFYYGAAKPPCLSGVVNMEEAIPTVEIRSEHPQSNGII